MRSKKYDALLTYGYDLRSFNTRQQHEFYRAIVHHKLELDDCYLDNTIPAYKLRKQIGKLRHHVTPSSK